MELSASQVYRLVTDKPERLSTKVLIALCDILDCTPADLIDPYAESARRKTAGESAAAVAELKPGLRPERARILDEDQHSGMPRPRRRQPDPARFPPCARCGQCYPGGADSWPEGRVCKYCYLQARLRPGTCADCGALTSLPGLNATGQPACPRCSGIPARFRCGCGCGCGRGREATAGAAGGRVGVDVPPAKRRGMATPERTWPGTASPAATPPSMPQRRTALSNTCAACWSGTARCRPDRRLADFQRWAAAKLDGIGNARHRQLLERFLRWRLLRHPRSGSTTAPLGHGPCQRVKQRLTVAIAFLAWPADRERQPGECTQHDLDQ